ncbi:MAG: hypothetical protein ACE5HX_04055 [bacterium]
MKTVFSFCLNNNNNHILESYIDAMHFYVNDIFVLNISPSYQCKFRQFQSKFKIGRRTYPYLCLHKEQIGRIIWNDFETEIIIALELLNHLIENSKWKVMFGENYLYDKFVAQAQQKITYNDLLLISRKNRINKNAFQKA